MDRPAVALAPLERARPAASRALRDHAFARPATASSPKIHRPQTRPPFWEDMPAPPRTLPRKRTAVAKRPWETSRCPPSFATPRCHAATEAQFRGSVYSIYRNLLRPVTPIPSFCSIQIVGGAAGMKVRYGIYLIANFMQAFYPSRLGPNNMQIKVLIRKQHCAGPRPPEQPRRGAIRFPAACARVPHANSNAEPTPKLLDSRADGFLQARAENGPAGSSAPLAN
jgi:hypothetical protein